jgi:periplasmic divalent cation tolerance protein
MPENTLIVLTTAPDRDSAEHLAERLIAENLAACVNISAEMTSVYRWKGTIERGTERQMVIKTTRARYDALQNAIREQHPYETPEILALSVEDGLPAYLDWITTCTTN